MIQTMFKSFLLLLSVLLTINTSFSYSGETLSSSGNITTSTKKAEDEQKTIKELQGNIQTLSDEHEELNQKIELLKEESKLGSFFKDDLNDTEIEEVKIIIDSYKKLNVQISRELTEMAKNFEETFTIKEELLNERKELYKELISYIKPEKFKEYLEYIEGDAIILMEKKEVNEDIVRKQEIIVQKVDKVKEKIEENKQLLNDKLTIIIEEKIDDYLQKLLENKKFNTLSLNARQTVINKIILKLKIKITNLKNTTGKTAVSIQRLELFKNIILKKLEEFRDNLQ